jgi:uncharacterized membrane protein
MKRMTKGEFLCELRKRLTGLPSDDIEERVNFYSEMIDDMMEEGLSENEAIEKIGGAQRVADSIIADTPLRKIIKERMKPKREITPWIIVLIVLGFPIWFSIFAAAVSVAISVIAVIISVVASLWAVTVSLGACAIGGVVSLAAFCISGNILQGLFVFGCGLVCGGLSIIMTFVCTKITKWLFKLIKMVILKIKTMFVKEKRK